MLWQLSSDFFFLKEKTETFQRRDKCLCPPNRDKTLWQVTSYIFFIAPQSKSVRIEKEVPHAYIDRHQKLPRHIKKSSTGSSLEAVIFIFIAQGDYCITWRGLITVTIKAHGLWLVKIKRKLLGYCLATTYNKLIENNFWRDRGTNCKLKIKETTLVNIKLLVITLKFSSRFPDKLGTAFDWRSIMHLACIMHSCFLLLNLTYQLSRLNVSFYLGLKTEIKTTNYNWQWKIWNVMYLPQFCLGNVTTLT